MSALWIAAMAWGWIISMILCVGIVAIAFIYWNDGYKAGCEDSKKAQP